MAEQPTIGVWGLGNRSTLFYLDLINTAYNNKFGGYSTCPFIMYNTDFDKLNPFLPNEFETLEPEVKSSLSKIEALGIDLLLVPNITLHETIDRLRHGLKLAHPVQLTIDKLRKNNQKEVVIFGSAYTMDSQYLRKAFDANGITVVELVSEEKQFIDYMRKQIYAGQETKKQSKQYEVLKETYASDYPVIIACTELSILSKADEKNVYDMAFLQVEEVVSKFGK